jgi:hypothetical protein
MKYIDDRGGYKAFGPLFVFVLWMAISVVHWAMYWQQAYY